MYKDEIEQKINILKHKKDVFIVAFETSCDETSAAVVKNGREVLSNIVSSQIDIHKRFGGVVPEVASRNHVEVIDNVLSEALTKANIELKDIDAVAVTYGAGLIGALMVGVAYAKSLAYALNVPLIAVNHIKAHIAANYIESHTLPAAVPPLCFKAPETLSPPFIALVVSGGHTAILKVTDYTKSEFIGGTVDDAIGECYDKVARVLGLEYPGGPKIDKLARTGNNNIKFTKHDGLKSSYDMSFSGLKTAVINYVHQAAPSPAGFADTIPDICCSFQTEAVESVVSRAIKACKQFNMPKLTIAGGVAANSFLRERLTEECKANNIELFLPQMQYCTDNAAMIGALAYFDLLNDVGLADTDLNAVSNLPL